MQLPVPLPRDEKIVGRDFWNKLRKVAGRIPFAEDAASAYFCAVDPATPAKVKATLFAALAYFVMPFDLIPDFVAGIGFTDDAAVIALALGMVARHVKEEHRAMARAALHIPEPGAA
ncbi:MAG: YkvA family protein [Rhizomicrobium sp.]